MTPRAKWQSFSNEELLLSEYPRAVIDADVLAKIRLTDLLLRIAENAALFYPLWTELILDEVQRAQTTRFRRPWSLARALHFRREVTRSFPLAMVMGYERWIGQCRNDEGDRHVLAAAIEVKAPHIITYNLTDFPAEALAPWGIRAVSPDDYLLALYAREPSAVLAQVRAIALKDETGPSVVLERLAAHTPKFSQQVLEDLKA